MALPNVTISIQNGQLGAIGDINDKIAGMVVSGAAIADPEWTAGSVKSFTSLADVEAAGIDAAYDTYNSTNAHQQIADFYAEAPEGTRLYILIAPPTETLTEICDHTTGNKYIKTLVDAAGGDIKLVGICRKPDGDYSPTYTNGLDDDVVTAITKAEAFADAYASNIMPVRILIEGRDYQGVVGDLADLKERTDNHVGVVICGSHATDKSASVGLALGRAAASAVQRKISRVKSGNLNVTTAYLSDGTKVDDSGDLAAIHDKGYIVIRTFPQKSGYFFASDHMATADTDDFKTLANGRVIDKALILAYQTYVEELGEEVEIGSDGKLAPSKVKALQGAIDNAVNGAMTANQEISAFSSFVDPDQNLLSSSNLEFVCQVTPVGYSDSITVKLGFNNPYSS